MKEQTYGWYPSAKNVYVDRRIGAPTPYQLEAMYRFRDSKYYEPPITPPEQKSLKRPTPTPTPVAASFRRPASKASKSSVQSDGNRRDLHVRAQSVPLHTQYKPPPRLNLPLPQQCWSTHVPETEVTVFQQPTPQPQTDYSAPVHPEYSAQQIVPPATPPKPTATPDAQRRSVTSSARRERIQSATIRREKSSRPERPIKSAGPVRPAPTPHTENLKFQVHPQKQQQSSIVSASRPPSGRASKVGSRPKSRTSSRPASRPKAPVPFQMEEMSEALGDVGMESVSRPETPDYFEEVRRHGWAMEVHGDPLKLKRITQRLPYTVKVDDPQLKEEPPKVHMENIETFFLNTIPRRPMAFAIDKEWISEMIHTKRMEVQKKHGLNYRYKNFSFVY